MKEEMTSVDVAAIVSEFNTGELSLVDAKIGKIYQTNYDEMRMTLHIYGQGRHNLVIQAGKRVHLTQHPRAAPQLPQGFPMLLRKHVMAGRIKKISQHDFDRIIEFEIIRADVTTKLIAELFARGNIILTDDEGRIIQPMKPVSFKDRTLRRGEIYELPPAQLRPLDMTSEKLVEIFSESDSDIVRTLATRLNMGGLLAEEVCLRAGIDKHVVAGEVSDLDRVLEALKSVFRPIEDGKLEPHIVVKDGKNVDVVAFGLERYSGFKTLKFNSFNMALDEYFSAGIEVVTPAQVKEVKKESVLDRRLLQQQQAIEKFAKQADQLKQTGDLIYAHYQTIEDTLKAISEARERLGWDEIQARLKGADTPQAKLIRSIDPSKGTLTLELDGQKVLVDIKLTIPQNAQMFYDKAKKISGKRLGAERAILQTEKLMARKAEPDKQRKGGKIKVKPRWYDRFRWFESSDGFLVVGGRDAGTNEDVVKKYMEKRDIFFHTEAPGSPAVVIKTEGREVPKTTLEEAARFVVSNSSVWKSGRVDGDCYWVTSEQVSKTPESGEYVPRGSFIIRGKRNYMSAIVGAAIGIRIEGGIKFFGGPPEAVRGRAQYIVEVEPGEFSQNDIAKKVYKMLVDMIGDRALVKSIASADKIAMMLPPGESRVKMI
ncbi:MAG: NFACT family protein [ANME-2 cluster archaeon]|nr:NFACT family protein [ANME-2 cluster archaeon]MDF1532309.1 ribosome rescue protein RqcH [ANME-2 cluster archaeon]